LKTGGAHPIFEIPSTRWEIRAYGNVRRRLFEEDFTDLPLPVRAEFRAVLNGLRDQPIEGWIRPAGFDRLGGQYRELGKLRFKVGNVQHRPLGFFGPGQRQFALLIWATERDQKYDPPGVRDTALSRMNEIKAGRAVAYEFYY
jgi:hypothetical protein